MHTVRSERESWEIRTLLVFWEIFIYLLVKHYIAATFPYRIELYWEYIR